MKERGTVPVTPNGYISCGLFNFPAFFSHAIDTLRCKYLEFISGSGQPPLTRNFRSLFALLIIRIIKIFLKMRKENHNEKHK